jgi:THO complex subunit 1
MASLFERQRADVESRLDAIVRGAEPVTSRALVSLQGALGLDDLILDDEGVPRDAPGSETRALVEHALCRLTQRVMQEETEGGGAVERRVDDADDDAEPSRPSSIGSLLDRCLDLALALSESGVADPGSVFVAAEQVFEASTLTTCARVFSWVERARARLSDDTLWKRGKLTVLRVCNDLKLRLSKEKTSDVVLRGRVSLLLSALYPLSERSALNIAGAYNNDEKRYDVERPSSDEIPRVEVNAATEVSERRGYAKNDVKNGKEGNASADVDALLSSAVDAAFYRTFWNLQIFFRDPQSTLAAGPGGWNAFRRSLEAVLAAFETHQLDRSAAAEAEAAAAAAAFAAGGASDEPRSLGVAIDGAPEFDSMDADDEKEETREPKKVRRRGSFTTRSVSADSSESAGVTYLTAAPLLRLQLRDAAFRRHFLTQCAVFLNHRDDIAPAPASSGVVSSVDTETNDVKRSEEASPETKEPDGRTQSDARAADRRTRAEADRLRRCVFSQLSMTPPAGAKFAEAVSLALRRERHWTRWKRENCRAFERAPEPGGLDAVPEPEPESRFPDRRADGRARRAAKKRESNAKDPDDVVSLGNPELDRLWNLRDDRKEDDLKDESSGKRNRSVRTNEELMPSASSFLRGVHEDADPEADIEEPYKRKNDAAFRWRLTRLLAAEDIGAFIKLNSEDLEAVAAEAMDLPPWPKKADTNKTPEETPRDAEEEAKAREAAADGDGGGGDGDGEDVDDGVPEEAEKKKRAVTTKTKTGGGEHTRFASTPATTDEFGGDSDMGSDSDGRALMAEVG